MEHPPSEDSSATSLGKGNLRAPSMEVTTPQLSLKGEFLMEETSVPVHPNSCLLKGFPARRLLLLKHRAMF